MITIEIQFEHSGTRYSATAEFLSPAQPMIRVAEFYPTLPGYRREVYFVYNSEKQKIELPFFPKKQKGFAEAMFASICESCNQSEMVQEMFLGANKGLNRTKATAK